MSLRKPYTRTHHGLVLGRRACIAIQRNTTPSIRNDDITPTLWFGPIRQMTVPFAGTDRVERLWRTLISSSGCVISSSLRFASLFRLPMQIRRGLCPVLSHCTTNVRKLSTINYRKFLFVSQGWRQKWFSFWIFYRNYPKDAKPWYFLVWVWKMHPIYEEPTNTIRLFQHSPQGNFPDENKGH